MPVVSDSFQVKILDDQSYFKKNEPNKPSVDKYLDKNLQPYGKFKKLYTQFSFKKKKIYQSKVNISFHIYLK